MFGLGIARKEIFLAYSIQFVFSTIRVVPGNVVMVAIDMCGKSRITGEWICGITWKHAYFNIFVLFIVGTTSILKLMCPTVYCFYLDGYFGGYVAVIIVTAVVVFNYLFICLFIYLFIYLFVDWLIYLLIDWLMHLFIYYFFCRFGCYSYFCCRCCHFYSCFCCWSHCYLLCVIGYYCC